MQICFSFSDMLSSADWKFISYSGIMAPSYPNTLKVKAVEWYISAELVSEVQRRLRSEYPKFFRYGKRPDRNTILK